MAIFSPELTQGRRHLLSGCVAALRDSRWQWPARRLFRQRLPEKQHTAFLDRRVLFSLNPSQDTVRPPGEECVVDKFAQGQKSPDPRWRRESSTLPRPSENERPTKNGTVVRSAPHDGVLRPGHVYPHASATLFAARMQRSVSSGRDLLPTLPKPLGTHLLPQRLLSELHVLAHTLRTWVRAVGCHEGCSDDPNRTPPGTAWWTANQAAPQSRPIQQRAGRQTAPAAVRATHPMLVLVIQKSHQWRASHFGTLLRVPDAPRS